MRLGECLLALYLYLTSSDSLRIGCKKSKWGPYCEKDCSMRCYNWSCDKVTGLCSNGCIGYTNPPECLGYCPLGFYGLNCSQECPSNCKDNVCDPTTGVCYLCATGLKRNNQTYQCNIVCERGTWGVMCNNTCAIECDGECSPYDGICFNGACPESKWGEECEYYCSDACFNRTCNSRTGVCECRSELCQQKVVSEYVTPFSVFLKSSLKLIQFYAILVAVVIIIVYVWLLETRRLKIEPKRPPTSKKSPDNDLHSIASLT